MKKALLTSILFSISLFLGACSGDDSQSPPPPAATQAGNEALPQLQTLAQAAKTDCCNTFAPFVVSAMAPGASPLAPPAMPGGQSCGNAISNFQGFFRTIDNGQYAQTPAAQAWYQGQGIGAVNCVGSALSAAGIPTNNPSNFLVPALLISQHLASLNPALGGLQQYVTEMTPAGPVAVPVGAINPLTGQANPLVGGAINPLTGQPYPLTGAINPLTGQPNPSVGGPINPVTGQPYYPGAGQTNGAVATWASIGVAGQPTSQITNSFASPQTPGLYANSTGTSSLTNPQTPGLFANPVGASSLTNPQTPGLYANSAGTSSLTNPLGGSPLSIPVGGNSLTNPLTPGALGAPLALTQSGGYPFNPATQVMPFLPSIPAGQ